MGSLQRCIECDSETGRCREDEMCVGDHGPLCEDCHSNYKCKGCEGEGLIAILRDESGKIDYENGEADGEYRTCANCDGEGYTR